MQELNRTGSFPDESDVHSLCYIKCYLEKIGVMSDEGDVNEERALQVLPDATKVWSSIFDMGLYLSTIY